MTSSRERGGREREREREGEKERRNKHTLNVQMMLMYCTYTHIDYIIYIILPNTVYINTSLRLFPLESDILMFDSKHFSSIS